ncbi:MAG: NAD(P)/FAD-dependent oxidoreductase [Planctomycetes bacterium]|nr:NAD(P)/FAD-dependent oxidoreductase [Planctomycetota bacterium]
MCAMTAGARGRSVVVLDHADRLGKKILISGGGRCNFTNRDAGPQHYRSQNPHFCRSALARYAPADFLALVERHRIAWHEKTLGQLFCDGSAKEIVALLLAECAAAGVMIRTGALIAGVERIAGSSRRFAIDLGGSVVEATSLVLATGGLSIPTIGASDLGYRLARQFGLAMVATDPALVPFILRADGGYSALSGIAVPARVACNGESFDEALLFTHAGLSGPVILQISSCWNHGDEVAIDLLPSADGAQILIAAKRGGSPATIARVLHDHLPKRLVQHWAGPHDLERPVARATDQDLARAARAFHAWTLVPSGTEGYRKAEVTRGGIDTAGLSSKTMEARAVPGLYCVGEIVDVTGWLGGYNFQWAWASGHSAGEVA